MKTATWSFYAIYRAYLKGNERQPYYPQDNKNKYICMPQWWPSCRFAAWCRTLYRAVILLMLFCVVDRIYLLKESRRNYVGNEVVRNVKINQTEIFIILYINTFSCGRQSFAVIYSYLIELLYIAVLVLDDRRLFLYTYIWPTAKTSKYL